MYRQKLAKTDVRGKLSLFADGLNAILLAYESESLGDLEPCKGGLIFTVNEQHNISTRKPWTNIVGTRLEHLRALAPPVKKASLDNLAGWVSRLKAPQWKNQHPVCQLPWQNVWNCIDIKTTEKATPCSFPEFKIEGLVGSGKTLPDFFRRD